MGEKPLDGEDNDPVNLELKQRAAEMTYQMLADFRQGLEIESFDFGELHNLISERRVFLARSQADMNPRSGARP